MISFMCIWRFGRKNSNNHDWNSSNNKMDFSLSLLLQKQLALTPVAGLIW